MSGSFHWELDIMNLFIGDTAFRPTQRSVMMDTGTSMIMIYQRDKKVFQLLTLNIVDMEKFYENTVKPLMDGQDL